MAVNEPGSDRVLTDAIASAYSETADAWASGPTPIYRRLAAAMLASAGMPLAHRRVLDLGAGTGVASELLREAEAEPIAVDLALGMLRYRRGHRPPAAVADAQALPFRSASFDAVVAAFCLNHLPDPSAGLAECRRVTRPAGVVLASTFPADADHPAKAVVETVLMRFGYQRPDWYRAMKGRIAELTGDADALGRAASDAGLTDVEVARIDVEVGLDDPSAAVEWRLDMPHTIGFVTALPPRDRDALRSEAEAALEGELPSAVPVLVLRGRAP